MKTTETFDEQSLEVLYDQRFASTHAYRNRVWQVLIPHFFQAYVPEQGRILDLGCGYGEFINNVRAGEKWALDLNPGTSSRLQAGIRWIQKRSTEDWGLEEGSLDLVFTSNFFEHLPRKEDLVDTLNHIKRALKPGGLLIALGPNMNRLHGEYWDFWDHQLVLTEKSLAELLRSKGFHEVRTERSFLPYTMVGGPQYPLIFVRLYLMFPFLWRIFGKQFLLVVRKP
ncbi:MAG: class I SAM-dependent methyltransferase [Blastochloris sp.]|nr:class I SAM-dependent methyltransferase [Blastochloris sp.]